MERMFDSAGVTMCTFNCEDNVADTVLVPCGHRVVCTRCVGSTLIRRCPLCYQQISAAKNSRKFDTFLGSENGSFSAHLGTRILNDRKYGSENRWNNEAHRVKKNACLREVPRH